MDQELNQWLLRGEHLDSRLFSQTAPVQYYQVANWDAQSPQATQAALDAYICRCYTQTDLLPLQEFSVLFYHKKPFVNYRTEAYEAARDSENGLLDVHRDALAAQFRLLKLPGPAQRWQRRRVLYNEQMPQLQATDTLRIEELVGK
ncbi:hypothetical protein [Hymenobacter negativus]|uniref:Uncharacterized protein n=1 Tax=Hymenobacter negativus TaxID=2795026 RepID=A0ABS3QM15_9BACT|nr:hypothetical protein [Hymenobacter negativus]MBO2012172.1 hypothetical protein [Hymenobacter negativus]